MLVEGLVDDGVLSSAVGIPVLMAEKSDAERVRTHADAILMPDVLRPSSIAFWIAHHAPASLI
jgi:hypothetical protein